MNWNWGLKTETRTDGSKTGDWRTETRSEELVLNLRTQEQRLELKTRVQTRPDRMMMMILEPDQTMMMMILEQMR